MNVKRLAPLSGIVYVVLTVVSFTAFANNTPDIKASATKVASFYSDHHTGQMTAAYMFAIASVFLAIFVASCGVLLPKASRVWAALFYGGGLIAVSGILFAAVLHLALADGAHHGLEPVALHALNALDSHSYIAFESGIGILLLGAAGAMIPLPGALRWFGWIALVVGIAEFTPVFWLAFLLSVIWIVVVSIRLFLRSDDGLAPTGAAGTS